MQNFHQGLVTITKQAMALVEEKSTPIILIDGRAGSGKSTFAQELVNLLFKELEVAPKLVHMDDLYPGWNGLSEGSRYLSTNLLVPLKRGKPAAWQIWDWAANKRGNSNEPGNGWREFSGGIPLIVEGCGSLSQLNSELADIAIWIEADSAVRKSRWEQRDGHKFDEFWPVWSIQEDEFYQEHQSQQLASLVIAN